MCYYLIYLARRPLRDLYQRVRYIGKIPRHYNVQAGFGPGEPAVVSVEGPNGAIICPRYLSS